MNFYRTYILLGIDKFSIESGVKKFEKALRTAIEKNNLQDEVEILETGSFGYFGKGICCVVYPDNITYANLKIDDIPEIVNEHLIKGRPVKRLILSEIENIKYDFNYDKRIVLKNSGIINPESIEDYLGVGGYEALEKALFKMKPEDVIEQVKKSKLRGRGGAGFPTGLKWSFTAPLKDYPKYLIINADEGEPGTFKDRLIMEGDPHHLLEGIIISAYAIGANKAYIYIRGEYALSIERLEKAIAQAKEYGLLGKNILGSGFDLNVEIKIGAGAYVCGEETALIESMEGNRGIPRAKPPYPGTKGLWGKPTVVNNVETIANIPNIIEIGGENFAKIGTEKSTGTKVFTILGDVNNPGLAEVEMGTTLRTIINKYGGGMKNGIEFKAALVGGAAGVLLSDELLNVQMDYENLKEKAAVLGSGAILVMGSEVDIAEMLESIIKFFHHESCGKCSPCRLGTHELKVLIEKINSGKGTKTDLFRMVEISEFMYKSSFCPLGQSLILPVKSAIENFITDFESKIS